MHFAPDAEASLAFTVDLANTVAGATKSGLDELISPAQVVQLFDAHRFSGRLDRTEAELTEVRATRERLRRIWTLDRDHAALEVNGLLQSAQALPRLMRHDGMDWHLHATDPAAPLAERILVEVALALVDVIRSDESGRLRACAAEHCDGLLVDLSRNGSKRFCSVRCGNRMNMVAFRKRAAGEATADAAGTVAGAPG
ncbi:CGNR zinc finger domain-containing protein [Cryobacterium sp. PAMC25264]|uniref:CGNR zinc finger domain-containing protein n=1 Tax=Cryobacterium sp. PAMC25264 TaxID=2861288 RepID=UPI001C62BF04|nr:CGNR zinc finger domain-containing protein [Cryobacterium sp. PAMC25264]QYF73954.1 CGNR zinc finger domain-containing protein [Cryobacterium sp. PAMC25264]